MYKTLIILTAMAAAVAGAASIATANNSGAIHASENSQPMMAAKETHGIVNCAEQVWPAIDAYCLTPASELGEIRQARLISF